MGRSINTSISIGASRSRVWAVLMDFARYPEWNPFIRSIKGEARLGEMLEVVIRPPGRKPDTFRPESSKWSGNKASHGTARCRSPVCSLGSTVSHLAKSLGGTHFQQSENFSGLLVPFVGGILEATERGFRAIKNEALQSRAKGG